MLVNKLGKPSIFCAINEQIERGMTLINLGIRNTEVPYKRCKLRNWYIEFRVEERLKSECRLVIGLIEYR